MKLKFFIPAFVICVAAFFAYSQLKLTAFAPAEDLPRGALLYAQIDDLPAFIKLWNESKFKENYLASTNFSDFSNNHLGRKLVSRWREFNDAAGFELNAETISGLANDRAAVAFYDIGKLEFVFVAPISDEIFAATFFFQNKDKFTSETLADGTEIFRASVNADRGRQTQELIFTHAKDRLIAVTSEKLLMQTLNNINDGKSKNRLIDEPDFAELQNKFVAHTATFWVNQILLNDDYYFRRYWLMSDVKDLKNIRAGMFDLEMREGKFVEHRRFLLRENKADTPVDAATAANLIAFAPENIPFYRLESAAAPKIDAAIRQTVFSRRTTAENDSRRKYFYSSDDDNDDGSSNYENPNAKFDEVIDDTEEDFAAATDEKTFDFSTVLSRTNLRAILTFGTPEILPAPLFVNFKRAALFDLSAPQNFDRTAFESAITREFTGQTMIANAGANWQWKTVGETEAARRELNLPLLGFSVAYILRGNILILTNDPKFLTEISAARKVENVAASFDSLTVINLAAKTSAYDDVFKTLDEREAASEFFTGNVASLLDSLADFEKIEVKKNYTGKILEEEIEMSGNSTSEK